MVLFSFLIGLKQGYFYTISSFKFFSVLLVLLLVLRNGNSGVKPYFYYKTPTVLSNKCTQPKKILHNRRLWWLRHLKGLFQAPPLPAEVFFKVLFFCSVKFVGDRIYLWVRWSLPDMGGSEAISVNLLFCPFITALSDRDNITDREAAMN